MDRYIISHVMVGSYPLVKQATSYIYQGKYEDAESLLQDALSKVDPFIRPSIYPFIHFLF